jgi:ankyrin repeat protein
MVRSALENLPNELDSTYDEAMERIQNQDDDDVTLATRVLSWISYALRPLAIQELKHALAVEEGDKEIDEEAIPEEELLTSICGGLVTIDHESNVIRLVHYTTQEYFDKNRLTIFPDGETRITATCVTYLSFNVFDNGKPGNYLETERFQQRNPFLSYAANSWGIHARAADISNIEHLMLNFLDQNSKVNCANQFMEFDSRPNINKTNLTNQFSSYVSGLWLATTFGATDVVRLLMERRKLDVDIKTLQGETPLYTAAWHGYEPIVQLLLEKGANTESPRLANGQTALHVSACNGHEAVVQTLLEHGANIDADDNWGLTALYLAAMNGHEAVVNVLLEKGANVNFKELVVGRTALQMAASAGYKGIVSLLLNSGANVESVDKMGRTALHDAGKYRDRTVVGLLLQRGANIEAKDRDGYTPLYYAIFHGRVGVVRQLLESARFGSKDERYGTALPLAARDGNENIVQLLLSKGAAIETEWYDGSTALHLAARSGNRSMTQILLKNGANIEAKTARGETALHLSIQRGNPVNVPELLLKMGANAEARDDAGNTAVDQAVAIKTYLENKDSDMEAWEKIRQIIRLLTAWKEIRIWGKEQPPVYSKEYSEATKGKACGHVFEAGEVFYVCETCGANVTCVLCGPCYDSSDHIGHCILVSKSRLGEGFCDCGDSKAWRIPVHCTIHSADQENHAA